MKIFNISISAVILSILLSSCAVLWTGTIPGPGSPEEYYSKPGSTFQSVREDLEKCKYTRLFPKETPSDVQLNYIFKVDYCMFDKGYVAGNGKPPSWGCQNNYRMSGRKLPICIARGAYD